MKKTFAFLAGAAGLAGLVALSTSGGLAQMAGDAGGEV